MVKKARPRRSAEETRTLMVDEGIRQLEARGVDFGIDHVTLDGVCSVIDVPRSSSHAAWAISDEYAPQAMFQRTVLERWIEDREGLLFADAAEGALAEAFEKIGDTLTRDEIVRIAIQSALDAAIEPAGSGRGSGFLSTDMAIKNALASQPIADRDPEIADLVRDTEVRNRDARLEDSYRPLGELLSMRPRAEFGEQAYEYLALAAACLVEGIALRHHITPERDYASRAIRDDGSAVPSTLVGVCVEALVDAFFEPAD